MTDNGLAALAAAIGPSWPGGMDEKWDYGEFFGLTTARAVAAAILDALDGAGWRLTARDKTCPHDDAIATLRAALDEECCERQHVWPCPTIPRCDEPGCTDEATCGWPTRPGGTGPNGGYRRTCGDHMRAALAAAKETP